ncbi:uncharacterized protein K441DRAFT_656975 [Cenococcum geophilum 1.58]|uniref:uncharacterized protein n=1 Tax=Cenococcum geophilum 1.58 TaxID=794803 RepID=UPI00358FD2BC|nr:hypothetical protein K441DRAFT_656975 [Cenococcum geophilum 1.58]
MPGELLNSSSSSANLNQAEEPQHHPRSKFLELPAELRLMIYDNLFSSLLVHINQRQDSYGSTRTYFIASACMEPQKDSPFLCAYPIWSIFNGKRCNHRVPERQLLNPLAFFLTCRLVYSETRFMIYSEPVLQLRYEDSKPFIKKLKSEQLSAIRRLSLTTPFLFGLGMTDDLSNALGYIQKKLPQLRGIGMQTPTSATGPWKSWFLSPELLRFRQGDDMKEVVLEIWVQQRDAEGKSMIVFKAEQTRDEWQKDEQGIRITNERKSIAKEEHRACNLFWRNWLYY